MLMHEKWHSETACKSLILWLFLLPLTHSPIALCSSEFLSLMLVMPFCKYHRASILVSSCRAFTRILLLKGSEKGPVTPHLQESTPTVAKNASLFFCSFYRDLLVPITQCLIELTKYLTCKIRNV